MSDEENPVTRKITVATYNIQSCTGNNSILKQLRFWRSFLPHDRTTCLRDIAVDISVAQLDVLTITEADAGSLRTHGLDLVSALGTCTELPNTKFFPTYKAFGFANQGNAIASKHRIVRSSAYRLSGVGEPRYLCQSTINFNGENVELFVTHLAVGPVSRKKQIGDISEILDGYKGPKIITGDFNSGETDLEIFMKRNMLQHASNKPTFPSWNPTKDLDHIFYSQEFKKISNYILANARGSDHLPLFAELELKP